MKYLPIAGLILATMIMSCKKERTTNHTNNNTPVSLKGSWELRVRLGTQVPNVSGYYLPGNGEIWSFTDSAYQYFENQLYDHGSYSITQAVATQTDKLMDELILNSDSTMGLFYQVSYDTLIIYRGNIASDGSIEKFLKQ